ncbi:glycosyltransferase [Pseudomonas sp. Xaverov 259]|uniref:glycosyltransferase family 2 protein n=1 Tax=Pseudomonas sp. Xaverov 259 TaxID=2666086 RepID=UPI001C5AF1AC|nr:glycosyltransferase [Pseudomonas sp. Xaverov 259]
MLSIPEKELPVDDFSPLVTIVIPVFNGSAFLGGAIESALGQTYSNIEVIVVNDGSHDDGATERVALSFGDRIRYLKKINGGVASALNCAIREMAGEYFSWLSHDDLYTPQKIAQQISFLNKYETARTVIYSDYSIFTDEAKTDDISVFMPGVPPEYFRYWLTARSALHGCSLLIPRGVFAEVGMFSEGLRTTQDYDLWFRAAEYFAFIHMPSVLIRARSHAGQDTRSKVELAFKESSELYLAFVKKLSYLEVPGASSHEVGGNYLILASNLRGRGFIAAGQYCAGVARHCGVSSIRILTVTSQAGCAYFLRKTILRLLSSRTKQRVRRAYSRLCEIQRGFKVL